MANRSYCRFENTMLDLEDCAEHLDDDVSEREQGHRKQLIAICVQIARDCSDADITCPVCGGDRE
jgi:hypothetical protein